MRTQTNLLLLSPSELFNAVPQLEWAQVIVIDDQVTTLYEAYYQMAMAFKATGYGILSTHNQTSWRWPGYLYCELAAWGVPLVLPTLAQATELVSVLAYRYPLRSGYKPIPASTAWEMIATYTEINTGRKSLCIGKNAFGMVTYKVSDTIDETKFSHQQCLQRCLDYCERNRDKELQKLYCNALQHYAPPPKPSELSEEVQAARRNKKSFIEFAQDDEDELL